MLELFDYELLLGNDGFYQVADRYHTNYLIFIDDWQMSDAFVGDERHTLVYGLIWPTAYHWGNHDLPYHGVLGSFVFEDDFSGIVALGYDADKHSILEDD